MSTFVEIDFNLFEDFYEIANETGTRLRFNNPSHSERKKRFLEKNKIDLTIASQAMDKLGVNHMKMTIIEKGRGEGFYIYSVQEQFCYKYKKTDKRLFNKNNW